MKTRPRSGVLLFGLRLLAAACGLGAMAMASPPPSAADVVHMSPFEVNAHSVDFQNWIKVRSPNYILYTDARFSEAADALREFEMLWAAAQVFFRREPIKRVPSMIVLPTSHSDWRKIAHKGDVQWRVAVAQSAQLVTNLTIVEYDWQEQGLSAVHAVHAASTLAGLNLEQPWESRVWFSLGVGSLMEMAEIGADAVTFGRPNLRMLALARTGWLPWSRFFKITASSSEFRRDNEAHQRLGGQCAAFLHYLWANPEPAGWEERLMEWAAWTTANEPTEAGFKKVFGHDWKTWQQMMEAHAQGGPYRATRVQLGPAACRVVPTKLELTTREMRELFVLAQILNQRTNESKKSLDALRARGLKTESLRDLMAEACLRMRRDDDALAELKTCIARGSENPAVYAMAAFWRFGGEIKKTTIRSRLSTAAAADIRTWCRQALEIEPRHVIANGVLAWAEALAPEIAGEAIPAIEAIYRRAIGDGSTSDPLWALAVAKWRLGDVAGARALAERLLDSPYADKSAFAIARELLKETAPRR